MKTHAGELELPQTLSECHVCIQQLMADLAESQARVAELEGQNQALAAKVRDLAHRVFGRKSERQTPSEVAAPEAPDAPTASGPTDTPSTESASLAPVSE